MTCADVIVSLAVTSQNNNSTGGLIAAGFAAMWSCFLACILSYLSIKAVFSSLGVSPFYVGFIIGLSVMLAQLFLMLMFIFFFLGSEAQNNGWGKFEFEILVFVVII